jgi:hypothetical protein
MTARLSGAGGNHHLDRSDRQQQVTNRAVGMGLPTQTEEPTKEVLGVEKVAVVADRGYFKIEDVEA